MTCTMIRTIRTTHKLARERGCLTLHNHRHTYESYDTLYDSMTRLDFMALSIMYPLNDPLNDPSSFIIINLQALKSIRAIETTCPDICSERKSRKKTPKVYVEFLIAPLIVYFKYALIRFPCYRI